MPRTVAYRAGGFTNCGIGYTKFSQEELAEMKDRVMTENEAKAIVHEIAMNYAENGEEKYCEALDTAIKALEEVQKYRTIEKDLKERYHANVDIPLLMHHFIETVFEGEKHEGFCLLTNEDAKAWEEYKAIGTPEECRAAMEMQTAKKPTPINYEKYANLVDNAIFLRGAYWCPHCKHVVKSGTFCSDCGQKLDWSDEQ